MPESTDYLCGGLVMAALFALLPVVYRLNAPARAVLFDVVHPDDLQHGLRSLTLLCDILFGSCAWYARRSLFFFFPNHKSKFHCRSATG